MAYVNKPRPYDKEYQQQKTRGEHERRMERQKGRRAIDMMSASQPALLTSPNTPPTLCPRRQRPFPPSPCLLFPPATAGTGSQR